MVHNWGAGDTIHLGRRTLRVSANETATPISRPL
jgi:hypothetical protein